MKDFHHPNVLGLTGVCFDTPDGVPFIILPLMANGSLKDYLRSKRTHVTNVDTLPEVCSCKYTVVTTIYRTLDNTIQVAVETSKVYYGVTENVMELQENRHLTVTDQIAGL